MAVINSLINFTKKQKGGGKRGILKWELKN